MLMIADILTDEEGAEDEEVSIPDDVLEEIADDTDEEDMPDAKGVLPIPEEEDDEEEEEEDKLFESEDDVEVVDFDTHDDVDHI